MVYVHPTKGRWIVAYARERPRKAVADVTSMEACIAAMRLLSGSCAQGMCKVG
jgi:hypothetical protein